MSKSSPPQFSSCSVWAQSGNELITASKWKNERKENISNCSQTHNSVQLHMRAHIPDVPVNVHRLGVDLENMCSSIQVRQSKLHLESKAAHSCENI